MRSAHQEASVGVSFPQIRQVDFLYWLVAQKMHHPVWSYADMNDLCVSECVSNLTEQQERARKQIKLSSEWKSCDSRHFLPLCDLTAAFKEQYERLHACCRDLWECKRLGAVQGGGGGTLRGSREWFWLKTVTWNQTGNKHRHKQ